MASKKGKIKSILEEKMDENYENIGDFMKRSGIPVSMETVRRLITQKQPVNTASLIMIAKYLDFSNEEIRDILLSPGEFLADAKELKYAEDFIELMGFGGDGPLSQHDKILLTAFRDLCDKNRAVCNLFIQGLQYICHTEGIEHEDLEMLIHPDPPEREAPPPPSRKRKKV